jgi:hypothetical protein
LASLNHVREDRHRVVQQDRSVVVEVGGLEAARLVVPGEEVEQR